MKRLLLGLFLLAGSAIAAPPHYGGLPAYLTLEGIPGSVNVAGRENAIEVGDVDFHVYLPIDRDDGSVTGTRKHNGFSFIKAIDRASPLLFQKVCTGESIAKAKFAFYEINDRGDEVLAYEIELVGVKVASVNSYNPDRTEVLVGRSMMLVPNWTSSEKVVLRYTRITFRDVVRNEYFTDSWSSR